MRTWARLIPAVLLAFPVLLPSVCAADDAETNAKRIERLEREVKDLRLGMSEILDKLNHMERRAEAIRRESFYGPPPGGAVPVPTSATIALQNQYAAPATVRINGMAYRVEPFQTRTVQGVPVAPFTFDVEVDGFGLIEPLRTENLRPTGHRITIYPRMN